jgi:hypothetical protein
MFHVWSNDSALVGVDRFLSSTLARAFRAPGRRSTISALMAVTEGVPDRKLGSRFPDTNPFFPEYNPE